MKTAIKTIAALALAVVILDLFCAWYYNPADYVWDDVCATDRTREPNVITSRAKEGFSLCRIDENGYNNESEPERIDVLMMGTSHTEGFNVASGKTTSAQLEARLEGKSVYNIGMSAHSLIRNIVNFDRALDRFQPTEYVIIETNRVTFNRAQVEAALECSIGRLSPTEYDLPEWITDRPLVRTLARQYIGLSQKSSAADDAEDAEEEAQSDAEDTIDPDLLREYRDSFATVFRRMKASADEHGVKLIIYYNPSLTICADGTAADNTNPQILDAFSGACADADITFINMSDAFLSAYENEHILPHGFCNTEPEYGHLNADGCGIVADVLKDALTKSEVNA